MSTADKAAAAPAAPATEEHKEDCACAAHKKPEPLYLTLNPNQEATVIESLCMNCYEQGTTRIMFLNVCHVPYKITINSFFSFCHLFLFFCSDSFLQGNHCVGIQLPALWLRVEGRPVWRHHPASWCPLHFDSQQGCCLFSFYPPFHSFFPRVSFLTNTQTKTTGFEPHCGQERQRIGADPVPGV